MGRPRIFANPKERAAHWRRENAEHIHAYRRTYDKDYYERNRDRINAYQRAYYMQDHIRVARSIQHRKRNLRRRVEVLLKLGGKCVRCGFDSDYRALQIDHINGGGRHDVISRGQSAPMRDVLAGRTEKYQLLCANCNMAKKQEDDEVRHARI